jgi:hypothetical protein
MSTIADNIFWRLIDDTSSGLEHLAVWGGAPGYLVDNTDRISTYYSRRRIYAIIDKLAPDDRKSLYILNDKDSVNAYLYKIPTILGVVSSDGSVICEKQIRGGSPSEPSWSTMDNLDELKLYRSL